MQRKFLAIPLLAALAACSDSSGPNGSATALGNVAVSFATQSSATGSPSAPTFAPGRLLDDTLTSGADTLIVTSAQIVLKEIELKRLEVADCAEVDACEKFEAGPVLISLPLNGAVDTQFELPIDTGRYTEIRFKIHKISGDDPADAAFIQANPTFDGISIRITGIFNGDSVMYETDLNVDQELALSPTLVVDGSSPINVTILTALNVWFRDQAGQVINPATGNKGEENESRVQENIKQSFEAFEDNEKSGSRN